ncbi:TonB-dependent receptor plug domain-containing protein [Rugamonas rubra]|uniref:TonB-dependent receptor plug domain-containing protein n=1 Tax=Rugamonas rubra TaxID=758825 RepID=UPI001FE723AF|nr:TonB-dependent receptor [Rugamonas rubra]
MRLKPLAAGVIALLCGQAAQAQAPAAAAAAPGQGAAAAPTAVVVTGSRIPRATLEGPSAVTVITGDEITKQGYKNVFDALSNQSQNSGFVQGADFGNTHTPSANAISLRGLGPNHTLILLNGHRIADFPIAYEGTVNFTNLANIPSSVVERIEILSGGASAIYGSDAIAGVVNVILKKQAEGIDVNLKAGSTTRGGGAEQRLQITGGGSVDRLNGLFSLELSEREPLWSMDRDFMSAKDGLPTIVLSRKSLKTGNYYDLGDSCDVLGDLYQHSTVKYATKKGSYCASAKTRPTYWTTQTKNSSQNFFGSLNYELPGGTVLFGDLLLASNKSENNTRGPAWTSASTAGNYFLNKNTGVYETWTKYIAPEEIGGVERYNRQWQDVASAVSFGARGKLPGSSWAYEAGYNASAYQSKNHSPRALANIDAFFLGPKLGLDASGVNIYAPDPARLSRRLTPAEFDSITANSDSRDRSWVNNVSLNANGELFQLPAGAVKLAVLAEAGRQGFRQTPDARINQGVFNTVVQSDEVAGTRGRHAVGAEASVPLLEQLNANLAGRYDRYKFADRSEGKLAYNGGLEWRPAKSLLVRGNYATSFRAPDMNYIFQARGNGYYASSTDYLRCAKAGQSIDNCDYANVSPGFDYVQYGSKELKSEKGKSFGAGLVWSPSADFDVSLDYWNIKIDDLVTNLSADRLLRDEADCYSGANAKGSPTCVDVANRVIRYAADAPYKPGEVKQVLVNPINAAYQAVSGIDIAFKYALRTAGYGRFVWSGNFSKSFSKKSRQFPGDPINDDLADLTNSDWPNKLNTSLNWNIGDWSSTLFLSRYGRVPNAAQTALLNTTTRVNASTVYRITPRTSLSLIVNNVFDKIKTDTSGGWPNYPVGSFSPAGRQVWLELNHHFGS